MPEGRRPAFAGDAAQHLRDPAERTNGGHPPQRQPSGRTRASIPRIDHRVRPCPTAPTRPGSTPVVDGRRDDATDEGCGARIDTQTQRTNVWALTVDTRKTRPSWGARRHTFGTKTVPI
jgi:hypothetical protein